MTNSRFQPGDHVTVRNVFRGRVQTVTPSIVVADTPELIATWIPVNTPVLNGVIGGAPDPDGRREHLSADAMVAKSWSMVPRNWHTSGMLRLKNPRAMWSLGVFWDAGMANLKFWYINIDAPYERTRFGFDTWDMFLDIVVQPDRKSWRYKDEDEFSEAVDAGIFTALEVAEVRASAAQALELIKSNRPPFDNVWANWRPDVLWGTPQVPDDWEAV
jgi:hypothetical protein